MNDRFHDRVVAAVGGHYLIEGEVGRGGMAAVFRAVDMRLNRKVAIKALPPEMAFNDAVRARFVREAQMAARLQHPNIVPIYAVDEQEGIVFFVMALVEGANVAMHLKNVSRMDPAEVRTIVADVADALDYAHRQGVVHRDIKPDNILIDRVSHRPMVTDFGIARAAAEEHRLTATGMAVGTPAYMSPEQAIGERDVDGRSDLYSLGVVAWHMLVGETPFKATNTPSMLMKHVSEPPPPLLGRRPDVPQDLAQAIERCLAKRPEDRWQRGSELRDALRNRTGSPGYVPSRSSHAASSDARAFAPAAPLPPVPAPAPPWPTVPPSGLSRRDLRRWERDRRHAMKEAIRNGYPVPERSDEERIAAFRRNLVSHTALSFMLFGINAAMRGFPWFVFPVGWMMINLLRQLGGFWADGIPLRRALFGLNRRAVRAEAPPPPSPSLMAVDAGLALAPPEILHGPHGAAIQRSAASSRIVLDIIVRMTPKEREMLPSDLEHTVKALLDRVIGVGTTLHRLDTDANGGSLGSLDSRIAGIRSEPQTADRQRRLALLERQRATLADLLDRRSTLLAQFESATTALETLKLDLVRFRSAGVSSALDDVTSATREARAVSRDIEHMLGAADEVRRL